MREQSCRANADAEQQHLHGPEHDGAKQHHG
jgi:hypothetical protein